MLSNSSRLTSLKKSIAFSSGHGALPPGWVSGAENVSPAATVYGSFFILKVVLTV